MRWLGLTLLAACSFKGPLASDARGPVTDADVTVEGIDPTVDASTCAAADVFAGRYHTCARRADGQVWCWGGNSQGEAGSAPASTPSTCPAFPNSCVRTPQVVAMPAASTLALGTSDTCALAGPDTYCWGADDGEELGDNGAGDAYAARKIVPRAGSSAIAIGDQHVCSISIANHDVECSGHNSYGEVGDNTAQPRGAPTHVMLTGAPSAIGVGYNHGCAIVGAATWCWGDNSQLELAPNASAIPYLFPIMVPNLSMATAVAGGDAHTCAVLADHSARCWGAGGYGQLGDGTFPAKAPQLVTVDLAGIAAIRPGNTHTCALTTAGAVYCWGSGFLPTASAAAGHPGMIALPAKAVSLAAGGDHDCAALVDGSVWCWGSNDHGQLGDGTTTTPTGRTTAVKTKLCM